MGRMIAAGLLMALSIGPAWAQSALQGKVETEHNSRPPYQPPSPFVPSTQTDLRPRVPVVQPRVPSAEDLRPLQGTSSPASGYWSMTILPYGGITQLLNSPEISWSVEYANPRMHHEWNVWLSRIMLVLYQDCSRFRCPNVCDHTCTINIRRDGTVVADIVPGGDVPSALFRNAAMRLQGQQVIDFPPDSKQDKVGIKMSLHYGSKPLPNSSIFKDAFGQPDARYPIEKTDW